MEAQIVEKANAIRSEFFGVERDPYWWDTQVIQPWEHAKSCYGHGVFHANPQVYAVASAALATLAIAVLGRLLWKPPSTFRVFLLGTLFGSVSLTLAPALGAVAFEAHWQAQARDFYGNCKSEDLIRSWERGNHNIVGQALLSKEKTFGLHLARALDHLAKHQKQRELKQLNHTPHPPDRQDQIEARWDAFDAKIAAFLDSIQ